MKTIFDYNPTKEELVKMFGYEIGKKKYLSKPDNEIFTLCHLFSMRDDKKNLNKYLGYLSDQEQMDFHRLDFHLKTS